MIGVSLVPAGRRDWFVGRLSKAVGGLELAGFQVIKLALDWCRRRVERFQDQRRGLGQSGRAATLDDHSPSHSH